MIHVQFSVPCWLLPMLITIAVCLAWLVRACKAVDRGDADKWRLEEILVRELQGWMALVLFVTWVIYAVFKP